jgi:ubiquinone biosynthesis protein
MIGSGVLRPMPRRRVRLAIADAFVQLPRPRRGVFRPGIILPILRLFTWMAGALGFFFGNTLDIVMRRDSLQRRAVRLRRVFEDIGGSFAKLGQQLSLRADILPYAYCVELSQLLDNARPFPTAEAIAIIERNLGRRLKDVFAVFDPVPIGAASLACVWQATLKSGERVAVKVRRPDIGRIIAADLRAFGWLLKLGTMLTLIRPGRTEHLQRDLGMILFDELNFRAEARYTDLFRRRSQKRGEVTAPRIYFKYCTDEVIVSELVSGVWMWELMAAVDNDDQEFLLKVRASGIEPKSLARKLFLIMQREAMDEPFHHADPHPANLIVLPNNVICFIDFGAIGSFSTQTRKAWREVWYHFMNGDVSRLTNAAMHFFGQLPPMDGHRLTRLMQEGFADFLYAVISRDAEWWERSSAQLWLRFIVVAQQFDIQVSRETLQLFRATLLYDTIITRLDRNIDYAREFSTYVKNAAQDSRERARQNRGSRVMGLTDMDYLGLEQIADSAGQFLYKLQSGMENPFVKFRNMVGKVAYTGTLLLRLAFLTLAAAGIAVLADTASTAWYGRGIDWSAVVSRWWAQLTMIVVAMVVIRRIVIRLSLPDHRVDPDR